MGTDVRPTPASLSGRSQPEEGRSEQERTELWRRAQAESARVEQMQRRMTIVAEVSRLLSESLDLSTSLGKVARHLVETTSRGCVIEICDDDNRPAPVAVAHRDPTDEAYLCENFSRSRAAREPGTLVTPIEAQSGIVGSLTLLEPESQGGWDVEERELVSDIGRRIGLFVENAGLYEKARRAISARDEFLSIAAHELRTPLTAMMLHIQALSRTMRRQGREAFSIEGALPKVEAAERQLGRLTHLIDALLDVSRIASHHLVLDFHKVDLADVARNVAARFKEAAAREGSTIRVSAESAIGSWDPARLDQIVANLVENAVKYGPNKPVDITVRTVGNEAQLSVRDHGIGIDPEHLDRIFNRFERAVSSVSYGGLGLGLYITRELAIAHGGTIEVNTAPGQGAEFVVKLPLGVEQADDDGLCTELFDDPEQPADLDRLAQDT